MEAMQPVELEYNQYKKENSRFTRLQRIILALSPQERAIILKHLGAFDQDHQSAIKTPRLFSYLIEHPEAHQKVVIELLGYKKDKASFDSLVQRLKDKIEAIISDDVAIHRKGNEYAKRDRMLRQVDKRLMTYEIYLGRGLSFEAYSILLKVISTAKEYEYYNRLVDALYEKRRFLRLRTNSDRYQEATKEIEYYERCLRAVRHAMTLYDEYAHFMNFKGNKTEFVKTFAPLIPQLEKDYREINSGTVGFLLYQIKLGYLVELKQYDEALQLAIHGLSLVKNNEAVFTARRMGMAYGNLADVYFNCRDFEKALQAIAGAQGYFKKNTLNYLQAEELEFLALFYSAEYAKAEKKIQSIINNPGCKQSDYLLNKRKYFYACVLFVKGEMTKCMEILESLNEILRDKEGWNLGRRILSVMASISKHEQEELTISKIRSLKRQIKQLKERKAARRREITILNLLNDLFNSNYQYAKVYKKRATDFSLLKRDDADYGLQIGSELIVFPEWFLSKVKNQPYKVDLNQRKAPTLATV